MPDAFSGTLDSVSAPATRVQVVVPHDVALFGDVPKALFVGSGGTVVLRAMAGPEDVAFRNVASGAVLPVRAIAVRATGTTAADIVALF